MNYRLLIIIFLSIICSAFADVDTVIEYTDDSGIISTIQSSSHDSEISTQCSDIIVARVNNFAANGPTRTLNKRKSAQRNTVKTQLYISAGKTICADKFAVYQLINNQHQSGHCEINRHLISLGKLII